MDTSKQDILALYTAEQVRELDRQAIAVHGIDGYDLMQRAADFMFTQLASRYADLRHWLVLCGAGNNAGDGYVIARLARESGLQVKVISLKSASQLTGAAEIAATAWLASGGEIQDWAEEPEFDAELIIDALLGTGMDRPLAGDYLAAVKWLNQQTAVVAAVDIPSGLSADTGVVQSSCVKADLSYTFIGRKQGLFTADGQSFTGELLFDQLAVPDEIFLNVPAAAQLLSKDPEYVQPRTQNSHKGSYGHLLVCGGQAGMSGAVLLAGETALRAGAGVVSIATDNAHAACINLSRPELMVKAVTDSATLLMLAERASVIALGPGLGTSDWGQLCFDVLVNMDDSKPVVLDADGLNLLAKSPMQRCNWVLTPHPAEAARLLGVSTEQVQQDRFTAIRKLAEKYQAVVVLKGSGSLVADFRRHNPAGEIVVDVCPFGNPGMASAGMGDVLTGLVAALLGQGLDCLGAARLAVVIHARAGDCLAEQQGQLGLLAADMPAMIRQLLNSQGLDRET